MVKPGNALLDSLAELGHLDIPFSESEEIVFDGHVMKISKLPYFRGNSFSRLEHERIDGWGWQNNHAFPPENIHRISWYLPRHRGSQWGIYFNLSKMMTYVDFVYQSAEKMRHVPRHEVANIVWAQVLRHEIEHCIHELVIAKGLSGATTPHNFRNRVLHAEDSYSEALATFYELTDFISSTTNRSNLRLVTYVTSKIERWVPYERWDKFDINREERMYAHNFGFYPSLDNPCEDFRNLIEGRASSPYISIPIYVIASNNDTFGHWVAACDITEKRFAKKILNSQFAEQIDARLSVDIASGFDVVVSHPGSSDTLVLNSVSNELLDGEMFTKLAKICNIHPEMLCAITRYWFV